MLYPIIKTKTQKVKFGSWLFGKRIKTTLQLASLGDDYYDIIYLSRFNGIKTKKIEKIKLPINSYITKQFNDDPATRIEIYNCSSANKYIAIHIKIIADIGILGTRTIYDQVIENDIVKVKNNDDKNFGSSYLREFLNYYDLREIL